MKKMRLNWAVHIARMDENWQAKIQHYLKTSTFKDREEDLLQNKLESWKDNIMKDVEDIGVYWMSTLQDQFL